MTSKFDYWKFWRHSKIIPLEYAAKAKTWWKWLWLLLAITFVALSVWSCTICIKRYLRYEVKTSIMKQKRDTLPFPAITFFNRHVLRGSKMIPIIFNLLAYVTAKSDKDLEDVLRNMNKTCKSYNESDSTGNLPSIKSFIGTSRQMTFDSFQSARKCQFGNKTLNCSELFANAFDEDSITFTFNPNQKAADMIREYQTDPPIQYGFVTTQFFNLSTKNHGPKHGFQVLLDTNTNDSCGSFHKYSGAGFVVMVHDSTFFFVAYAMTPSFFLSPGYVYDIAMQVKFIDRKTKELGYCRDRIGNQSSHIYYSQDTCYGMCALKQMIELCQCVITPMKANMNIMNDVGIYIKKYPDCTSTPQFQCYSKYIGSMGNQNFCPYKCLPACQETQYHVQITATRLNPRSNRILKANFYIEDMVAEYIEENQAYVIIDLVLDIAGGIYTFLGLTIMNIIEFLFTVFKSMSEKVVARCKRFRSVRPL